MCERPTCLHNGWLYNSLINRGDLQSDIEIQTVQVDNGTDRKNEMVDRHEVRQEDEMEGDCRESQVAYDSELVRKR